MGLNDFDTFLEALKKSQRILLISHISPDGDTVGSVLGLRLALLQLGKSVQCACDGQVPVNMGFLNGSDTYLLPAEVEEGYDTALAVDVSAPEMMGKALPLFERAPLQMVIDHHATNPIYGQINFIRGGESACCQLAYETVLALGVQLTPEIANCLLLGLSTDTGHFQYAGTNPATLRSAAALVEAGADIAKISRMMYRTQSMNKLEMTKRVYEHIRFEAGGQIGTVYLTSEDYAQTNCTFGDADGLVNRALEVQGVRMAFLASERPEGIKMSLRAVEPDTVNDIAVKFGGGGHAQAAGCTIHASLQEAYDRILEAMKAKL